MSLVIWHLSRCAAGIARSRRHPLPLSKDLSWDTYPPAYIKSAQMQPHLHIDDAHHESLSYPPAWYEWPNRQCYWSGSYGQVAMHAGSTFSDTLRQGWVPFTAKVTKKRLSRLLLVLLIGVSHFGTPLTYTVQVRPYNTPAMVYALTLLASRRGPPWSMVRRNGKTFRDLFGDQVRLHRHHPRCSRQIQTQQQTVVHTASGRELVEDHGNRLD